jgi:hypothetical protein
MKLLLRLPILLLVFTLVACRDHLLQPEEGTIYYALLYSNDNGGKSSILFEVLPTSGGTSEQLTLPIEVISGWQEDNSYYRPPCPRWTLDKHYVAFSNGPNITIYDFHKDEFKTVELNFDLVWHLAWSPDNSKLAFAGNLDVGKTAIWLFDLTSNKLTRLTECDNCHSPVWRSDGSSLAYIRAGVPSAIEIVDFSNGFVTEKFLLSDDLALGFADVAALLDWSPQGSKLVFIAGKDSKRHLFVLDLELSQIEQIELKEENIDSPRWSPSGEQILYRSRLLIEPVLPDEEPTQEIPNLRIISLDGSKQFELTNRSGTTPIITCPQWLPADQ